LVHSTRRATIQLLDIASRLWGSGIIIRRQVSVAGKPYCYDLIDIWYYLALHFGDNREFSDQTRYDMTLDVALYHASNVLALVEKYYGEVDCASDQG
jgi:hypothetical protein